MLDNFTLINFPLTGKSQNIIDPANNNLVFYFITCSRILGIHAQGPGENLFHPSLLHEATLMQGADAYHFFLRIISGLESANLGEHHILGQVRASWTKFSGFCTPQTRKQLQHIVSSAFEDAKPIRTHILNFLPNTEMFPCAADLVGIKGGEHILIVAGEEKYTQGAALQFGKEGSRQSSTITIASSSEKLLSNYCEIIGQSQMKRKISCPIDLKFIEDVQNYFFDTIFISDKYSSCDAEYAYQRVQSRNILDFSRTDSSDNPRIYTRQDVRSLSDQRQVDFDRLIGIAECAIELVVQDRCNYGSSDALESIQNAIYLIENNSHRPCCIIHVKSLISMNSTSD